MSQKSMNLSQKSASLSMKPMQGTAPNTTTYTIAVRTSDVRNAGTDANVYVQLTGENGIGPQVQLKTSLNHRNKFERNHSDVFVFNDQKPLGPLKQLKIWHDNSGIGPGWHLQVVEVNDGVGGVSYVFPCNQWLDKKEGDKQLCRMLKCARTKQKMPKQLRIAAEMQQQQQPADAGQGQDQGQGQQPQQGGWPQQGYPQQGQQGWPPQGQQGWPQQQGGWPQQQGQGSYVTPHPSQQYKSVSPTRIKVKAPAQGQESTKSSDVEELPTSEM